MAYLEIWDKYVKKHSGGPQLTQPSFHENKVKSGGLQQSFRHLSFKQFDTFLENDSDSSDRIKDLFLKTMPGQNGDSACASTHYPHVSSFCERKHVNIWNAAAPMGCQEARVTWRWFIDIRSLKPDDLDRGFLRFWPLGWSQTSTNDPGIKHWAMRMI